MSEMIERAAKAIFGTHHEATLIQWDELSVQAQEEFLTQARAAIEAMRQPTQTMLDKGIGAGCRFVGDHGEFNEWPDPEYIDLIWDAMVSAAISDSNGVREVGG